MKRRLRDDDVAESDAVVVLPTVTIVMAFLAAAIVFVVWWSAAQAAQAVADATTFEALSIPVLGTSDAFHSLATVVNEQAAASSFPPMRCSLDSLTVNTEATPATVTTTVICSAAIPFLPFNEFQRSETLSINPTHAVVGGGS